MRGHDRILQDPAYVSLLRRRSRLRWTLTSVLGIAYLVYGLAGIYASDLMGARFPGTRVSWAIVIGYVIIASAIALSLYYVRKVRRLGPDSIRAAGGDD